MNHKRKGPKSTRSGCLMCKPHKHQGRKDGWNGQSVQERKSRVSEKEQKAEVECTVESCLNP